MPVTVKETGRNKEGEIEVLLCSDLKGAVGAAELKTIEAQKIAQDAAQKYQGCRCAFTTIAPFIAYIDDDGRNLTAEVARTGGLDVGDVSKCSPVATYNLVSDND